MARSLDQYLEVAFIGFIILLGLYYMFLAANTNFLGDDEQGYYYNARMFSQGKMELLDIYGYPIPFPGLVFMTFGSFLFLIFGPSLSILKMVSVLFGLLTLLMIYLVGRRINVLFGISSSVILLSVYLFSHYMFLAYTDLVITFFSISIFYLFLKEESYKNSIFMGVFLGLAYYAKSSALTITAFLFIFSLFRTIKEKDLKYFKMIMISIIISFLILAPYLIRNIILFRYPLYDIFNTFFEGQALYKGGWPNWLDELLGTISPVRLSLDLFISTAGWLLVILSIFGFSWLVAYKDLNLKEKEILFKSISFVTVFLIIFFGMFIIGFSALEPRHMLLILPFLSLASGFFMLKLKEKNRFLIVIVAALLLLSIYQSVTTAVGTSTLQRFPDDHIQAINWIKSNTEPDDLIFTTYGGPLGYYGERFNIWAARPCMGEEFPTVMTTTDGNYIKETLKKCDVSYILIWRATVAQDYVIPASNLWGVYTYNFMNLVLTDTENFEVVYSNENNVVLKILYDGKETEEPLITNITESIFG